MGRPETRKKILETAMDLFARKGYSEVKTKEIADHAEMSEVTLFRYFSSKRDIFKTVIQELMHTPVLRDISRQKFSMELEKDLLLICNLLKDAIDKNKKIIKMNMKDINGLSEGDDSFMQFPEKMKNFIIHYVKTYNKKKKSIEHPESFAIAFLSAIFGLCMNFFIIKAFTVDISFEQAAGEIVRRFSNTR